MQKLHEKIHESKKSNCWLPTVADMSLTIYLQYVDVVYGDRRLYVDFMPNVDIYIRDHLMDTGRFTPSQPNLDLAFEDPL